jgi:hypothetical protein
MANPKPNPAYQFKKGEHKVGRAIGTPNKMTLSTRQIIDDVFHGIGGTKRMIDWINKSPKNEAAWWNNIWARTIPQSASVNASIEHTIDVNDLPRLLEANGLPPTIFGRDVPVIDAEPVSNVPAKLSQEHPLNGQSENGDADK